MSATYTSKTCQVCGKVFEAKSQPKQKYCSQPCRKIAWGYSKTNLAVPTGTVGAIAELIVSADLMSRGYETYRALSPSSSCDLLTRRNGETLLFEVRTGRYYRGDRLTYPPKNIKAPNLAVVTFSDMKIHYLPELS